MTFFVTFIETFCHFRRYISSMEDRKPNGRFSKGNPGGPGNPYSKYQERFRAILMKCVKPKDFRVVCKSLLAAAQSGDIHAQRLLLSRLLGKEVQSLLIDTPIKLYDTEAPTDGV